ncbi:hypothetical protein B0H19DRAFT_1150066 [Mycena capillaripes]|nr:hypothetical protein B0H19DRAFT_1150066 [Mycena capillaripes]
MNHDDSNECRNFSRERSRTAYKSALLLRTPQMAAESPLNPGAPARKRSSLWRFSLWIGLVLGALFLAKIVVNIGQQFFWFTTFSHSRVFQNQTLAQVKDRAAVVRPLIDENQSFDIALSIWTLPVEDRDDAERIGDVAESPLFSNIIFSGVRLSDKHVKTTTHYRLPIAIFRRLLLKENDLRASFVLIPTSPSLLDHVTDFSTWRPDSMRIPPVRSWPFPLESPDKGPQSVTDRALDSFAISMPLLEFHEFRSKCAKSDDSKNSGQKLDEEDNDDGDEADWVDIDDGNDFRGHSAAVSDIAKNPEHAVKRHPFVVTRTQIRVVDEVHIFNRKAFNKEHKKLKSVSCGQGRNTIPDHNLCRRTYMENGNWETQLKLQIPDENGEPRTEWAYAPYMGHGGFSAGPKDIIPIPVTRGKCAKFEDPSATDPEFIDVDWEISYSGRTPGKFVTSELFAITERVGHHESDHKKAKAHDKAELWNGVYGHQFYEDAHPRRRLIISILASTVSFVLAVLDLGYWYTRTSTVSISVSGTVLIALSAIIAAFTHIANTAETDKMAISFSQWLPWVWLILMTLVTRFSLPLLMLKTVTRLEFSQKDSSWVPSVRLVGPSHKERNSQRLDSRTSWGLQAGVCFSLAVIYYLFSPDDYHVLSANLPQASPDDHPTNSVARFHALIFFPLQFTGRLSQLLLNHRSKIFAGSYKAAVVLRSILLMLALVVYAPSVVGRFDARPGLSAPQVVDVIALGVTIWQAVTFPKAIQKMEDEDNE